MVVVAAGESMAGIETFTFVGAELRKRKRLPPRNDSARCAAASAQPSRLCIDLTASDGEDEEVVEDADEDLARKLARELQAQEAEEQLRQQLADEELARKLQDDEDETQGAKIADCAAGSARGKTAIEQTAIGGMGELGGKGMTGNSAGSKKTKQQLTAKDKEATVRGRRVSESQLQNGTSNMLAQSLC